MFSSLMVTGLECDEAVRARGTCTDVAIEVEIEACIECHVTLVHMDDVDLMVAFRHDDPARGEVFDKEVI